MRRLSLLLVATLLLTACAAIQQGGTEGVCDCRRAVNVPDKAFRGLLLERGYAVKGAGRRMRPTDSGCTLKTLECYGRDIRSLRGIEMFPQLEEVVCSDNPLHELDLNALPRLKNLYALNVPLEHLALDSCRHLQQIQLSHTHLHQFDPASFPELELLLLIFTPLTEIDLHTCKRLHTLYLRGTQVDELDLRSCVFLSELHALDTPLRTLVVTEEQLGRVKASVPDSVRVVVR